MTWAAPSREAALFCSQGGKLSRQQIPRDRQDHDQHHGKDRSAPDAIHSKASYSKSDAFGFIFLESSNQYSKLVEISKRNGDFKKNYGKLIGAYLYLRSISAARGRSFFWTGLISIVCSAALAWLARHGLAWLRVD